MHSWHHHHFLMLASQSKDSVWPVAVGAFLGAFFAFFFGLIAYFLQKKFDRYHKHTYAVVETEYLLQEHLDRSYANQFLLEGAIKTIRADKFSFTLMTDLRFPEDLMLRLGELALINRVADYQTSIIRMNHSMQTWQKMNEMMHQAAIAGALVPQAKKANQEHLIEQATTIIRFLKGLDEDTKYLVAYVRVFMSKDKHIWSIPLLKRGKELGDDIVSDQEVKDELKRMEKEIVDRKEESKAKIKKVLES